MHDPDKLLIFEILAKEHEPMLMAYILSLVPDRALAQDIAQQTLVIAFRKISLLKRNDMFPAWLRGIARLEVFSTLRRHTTEIPVEPAIIEVMDEAFRALELAAPADSWEDRFKLVEQCFEALPPDFKQVCQLHYIDERKAREIAVQLQIALATVLKRLERARHAIKSCVEGRLKAGASYG